MLSTSSWSGTRVGMRRALGVVGVSNCRPDQPFRDDRSQAAGIWRRLPAGPSGIVPVNFSAGRGEKRGESTDFFRHLRGLMCKH